MDHLFYYQILTRFVTTIAGVFYLWSGWQAVKKQIYFVPMQNIDKA